MIGVVYITNVILNTFNTFKNVTPFYRLNVSYVARYGNKRASLKLLINVSRVHIYEND